MRRILLGMVLLAACGDAKPAGRAPTGPSTRTITAAALEALPVVPVTEGRLVCLATGQNACPATSATANWLGDGRHAVWEPHHQIQIWSPNKTEPQLLGDVGGPEDKYDFVVSVAATSSGYIVLSGAGMHALRYDASGKFQSSIPFPPVGIAHATGYSGNIPFYQVIHDAGRDSAAEFEVREIDTPGDTLGRSVLKVKLPWLRLRDGRPIAALPLFPILPSYAIAPDSDLVWSVGDRFTVERRSPSGTVRWSLTSEAAGAPVTAEEVAEARNRLPKDADKATRLRFDSSVANTPKTHPAVAAIYLAPDGRVAVVSVGSAAQDSVRCVVLGSTGQPAAKFTVPRATRILLFAGDSLLVQRPGANAQQELRWLMAKVPATP